MGGPSYSCAQCGTRLTMTHPATGGLQMLVELVSLSREHGELPVYGPHDRQRVGGRDARGAGLHGGHDKFVGTSATLPVFVYCPARGCNAGQHVG